MTQPVRTGPYPPPRSGSFNHGVARHGELGSVVSESLGRPDLPKGADLAGVRKVSGSKAGKASAMFRRLGIRYFQVRASTLVAVGSGGKNRHLGECKDWHGSPMVFDAWVPHFGVAFDVRLREETEIAAKLDWCKERGVIYFATDSENDLEELEQVIRDRMTAIRAAIGKIEVQP